MKFANGYNFIYEKLVEANDETAKRKLFASKTGKPEANDAPIDLGLTDEQIANIKLVYVKDGEIMVSNTGLPSDNDTEIILTINGEPVLVPSDTTLPEGAVVVATIDALIAAAATGGYIVLGADLETDAAKPVQFAADTTLDLNGKTFNATNDVALRVLGGATLTIKGEGTVNAQEGCAMAFDGSTLNILGGTYNCRDNFVVGTNGTAGRGNNKINIEGGTFNGHIVSNGYIACGIYVANSDTVTVNGGEFNITNGCGILARSGVTTVNAGTVINTTGTGTSGKVGDSPIAVPAGESLVVDQRANYPGGKPALTNNTDYTIYTIDPVVAATNPTTPAVTPGVNTGATV